MTVSDLPRGPHSLPRAAVERSQRRRIVEATATLVAEHGYAGLRVANIARLAGVSRSTIYELFADKEEAMLACYQAGSDTQRRAVEAALAEPGAAEDRLRRAITAYLAVLDADPVAARAFLVEPQHATPRLRGRFRENQASYIALFEAWHADWRREHGRRREVDAAAWSALLYGIVGLISEQVEGDPDQPASRLLDTCVELVLAVAASS